MKYDHPRLLEQLAAAYVLGTMNARARRRFSRLLEQSPAAQRAVADWNDHLQALNRSIPAVTPPARVWQAIARHIQISQTTQVSLTAADWLQKIFSGWAKPALAFAFGVAMAVGLIHQTPQSVGLEPASNKLAASYVGLLTDASGAPVLAASALRQGRILSIKMLKPLEIPPGKVALLWALPKDAAPIAVSVIPGSGKADIPLNAPAENTFAKVSRLAVTYETAATAQTPSEFVLSGHCIKIW